VVFSTPRGVGIEADKLWKSLLLSTTKHVIGVSREYSKCNGSFLDSCLQIPKAKQQNGVYTKNLTPPLSILSPSLYPQNLDPDLSLL
jgi:hypothetical protein